MLDLYRNIIERKKARGELMRLMIYKMRLKMSIKKTKPHIRAWIGFKLYLYYDMQYKKDKRTKYYHN